MFVPRKRVNVHRLDGFHTYQTEPPREAIEKKVEENERKQYFSYEECGVPTCEWDASEQDSIPADFRLKVFEAFVIREGISEEGTKRLIAMMTLVYEREPPFSFGMFQREMSNMKKEIISSSSYLCGICGSQKYERTSSCNGCNLAKPRLLDTTTIVVLNVKHQLLNFLKEYGKQVIQGHQSIHDGSDTFDKFDTKRYSAYRDFLEIEEDFNRGIVNLVCTVSSDGAKYKRLSRREITPCFLRVECGPPVAKRGGRNMAILSMTFATGGVKKINVDDYVEKTLSQLSDLCLQHIISGRSYLFKIVIMGYVADMKEINLLTNLPNWHEKQGCGMCITTGSKKPNGKVTFDDATPAVLRTDDSVINSARTGTSGFKEKKIPKVYEIIQPTAFQIDPFHIRSAGVCSDYLSEIIRPHKWTKCRLKAGRLDALKESFDKNENNTNDRVKLQSLRNRTRCTGRETEKMSLYASALTSFTQSFDHPDFNVFSLGLYHTLTFLGSNLEHDRGALRLLLAEMYKLHVHLERSSVTIKWHCFYQHLLEHEERLGPVYTTEVYEREHRNLMTSVHQNTTCCEELLPMRYVCNQQLRAELRSAACEMDGIKKRNLEAMLRTEKEEGTRSNTSYLHFSQLDSAHQRILIEKGLQNWRFLKRMIVANSTRNFYLSPINYWKTARTTQNKFCWIDSITNMMRFGEALVIFEQNQEISVLTKEYLLEPFQEMSSRFCNDNLSTESLNVLRACASFPTTFGKITNVSDIICVVPSSSLLAPAASIRIDDDDFIKIIL